MFALLFLATVGFAIAFSYHEVSGAAEANRVALFENNCMNCHATLERKFTNEHIASLESIPELKKFMKRGRQGLISQEAIDSMTIAHEHTRSQ